MNTVCYKTWKGGNIVFQIYVLVQEPLLKKQQYTKFDDFHQFADTLETLGSFLLELLEPSLALQTKLYEQCY